MKYFIKYLYYLPIAAVFAGIISALCGSLHWELLPIFTVMLYFLRLLDDHFDYKTDNKVHLLSEKALLLWAAVFGCAYICLNIIFYALWGLISVALAVYMVAENRFEWMKPLLLPLSSAYYLFLLSRLDRPAVIVYLALSLMASIGFMIYKGRKRR